MGSSSGGSDIFPLILATSDGGVTWNTQVARPVHTLNNDNKVGLRSVTFVNDHLGWAVGDTNGGVPGDEAPFILDEKRRPYLEGSTRYGKAHLRGLVLRELRRLPHGWAVGGAGGEQSRSPAHSSHHKRREDLEEGEAPDRGQGLLPLGRHLCNYATRLGRGPCHHVALQGLRT